MTVTEDLPASIWADDLIGRESDANFLEAFLVGRMADRRHAGAPGALVINVDGHWGAGKTYFMERFGMQLAKSGHIVADVNAWRDDHMDDPFIAILSAIDGALKPYTTTEGSKPRRMWDAVKKDAAPIVGRTLLGVAKTFVKRHVGAEFKELVSSESDAGKIVVEGVDRLGAEIERIVDKNAEHLIAAFAEQTKAAISFRERLGSAIQSIGGDKLLFVLVDELDRCRPSYAVSLLERVKHLFDADNLVFVFCTNSDQLQHSVKGAYGSDFDGYRYLKRFFERTYVLPQPSPHRLVRSETTKINLDKVRSPIDPTDFLVMACDAYSMNPRQIKQVLDTIGTVIAAWPHKIKLDLIALLPLAAEFDNTGKADWDDALNGALKRFSISFEVHRSWRFQEQSPHFSVHAAFLAIRDNLSLEDAINLERDGSMETNYVHGTFSPEWNGIAGRRTHSILASLPQMIEASGNMRTP